MSISADGVRLTRTTVALRRDTVDDRTVSGRFTRPVLVIAVVVRQPAARPRVMKRFSVVSCHLVPRDCTP